MRTDHAVSQISTAQRKVILLPIGSCEQHGPYLPIDTDLRIVQLIAEKVTEYFQEHEILLMPAIPFSASWEHKGPGTIALNVSTLGAILHDIARSIKYWNTSVLFIMINWHGGNSVLSSLATEITATEHIPTATIHTISLASHIWHEHYDENPNDIHAGALETSIIKAYWPQLLTKSISQTDHYAPNLAPIQIQTALEALGIYQITHSGIWGNPENADAEKGKTVIRTTVQKVQQEITSLLDLVNKKSEGK